MAPIKELPDDLRDDPALKDFNDLPSLAKSFKDTKAFVGRSIQPPGDAATPEQKDEFYAKLRQHAPHLVPLDDKDEKAQELVWEKLGRPKDTKGYEFQTPKDVEVDLEPLRALAKEAGLTKGQFSKLASAAVTSRTAALEASKADQASLKNEWGAATQEKLAKASAVAQKLGEPDAVVKAIAAGTMPSAQLKRWDAIATAIGTEPAANGGGGPARAAGGALTPAEAEAEIAALQVGGALYDKHHPQHAVAKQRYLKLMEYATPSS